MKQWNKVSNCRMAAKSKEGEDIWQDIQEGCRAGD
jgi:hypothetical protein